MAKSFLVCAAICLSIICQYATGDSGVQLARHHEEEVNVRSEKPTTDIRKTGNGAEVRSQKKVLDQRAPTGAKAVAIRRIGAQINYDGALDYTEVRSQKNVVLQRAPSETLAEARAARTDVMLAQSSPVPAPRPLTDAEKQAREKANQSADFAQMAKDAADKSAKAYEEYEQALKREDPVAAEEALARAQEQGRTMEDFVNKSQKAETESMEAEQVAIADHLREKKEAQKILDDMHRDIRAEEPVVLERDGAAEMRAGEKADQLVDYAQKAKDAADESAKAYEEYEQALKKDDPVAAEKALARAQEQGRVMQDFVNKSLKTETETMEAEQVAIAEHQQVATASHLVDVAQKVKEATDKSATAYEEYERAVKSGDDVAAEKALAEAQKQAKIMHDLVTQSQKAVTESMKAEQSDDNTDVPTPAPRISGPTTPAKAKDYAVIDSASEGNATRDIGVASAACICTLISVVCCYFVASRYGFSLSQPAPSPSGATALPATSCPTDSALGEPGPDPCGEPESLPNEDAIERFARASASEDGGNQRVVVDGIVVDDLAG